MTQEAKLAHTPTPWVAVDQGFRIDHVGCPHTMIFGGANHGLAVATVHNVHPGDQPGDLKDQRDANAAFIVRACNSHSRLLVALEHIKLTAGSAMEASCNEPEFSVFAAIELAAHAAIKAVSGVQDEDQEQLDDAARYQEREARGEA